MKNVDVEIYINQFITFFNNNPNDLIELIGDVLKDDFYDRVKEQSLVNAVSIAPNPISGSATVKIILEQNVSVNANDLSFLVYDQLGREVMNYSSIPSTTFMIEKGNLASGNYIYKVMNNKDQSTLKTGKIIFQ